MTWCKSVQHTLTLRRSKAEAETGLHLRLTLALGSAYWLLILAEAIGNRIFSYHASLLRNDPWLKPYRPSFNMVAGAVRF